jgi:NAD+ synthetase
VPRIAIAQFRPKKGDYAANVARIGAILAEVTKLEPKVDLVITPETSTSGYFLEGGVRDVAVTAGTLFEDLVAVHQGPAIDVAVGFYEIFRNRFHNSCLYATLDGQNKSIVRDVHRKIFLPTYGVFDEERYVERGNEGVHAFDTGWGGRAAVLICEDAWHSIAGTIAALDGAQLIIVPSASPARGSGVDEEGTRLPASMVRWEQVVRGMAGEHGVYVALASLVGFEGGKGFPGGSILVGPSGEIVSRAPLFDEGLMLADVDLDQITHVRADSPLLADLEVAVPHLVKGIGKRETGNEKRKDTPASFDPATKHVSRFPIPASRFPSLQGTSRVSVDPLALDADLVNRWLVAFLRDEVVVRRKFQKGIVALSGGVDSALTAFLAVQALGKENVIGVRLPYRTSSPESLEHARLVIDHLGIQCETVDISLAVDGYLSQVKDAGAGRSGNVMARERMIALFDLSERHKALPLGTGNKSERLLGYFTWHADDTPPVNPLGDLFKTQVWTLARHVGVPEVIVSKPATADLVAGQTDEGDFGISYPKADRILYELISGRKPRDVQGLGFTAEEVERVRSRLDATHWKRRLPTVAMLSQTAIGEFYLRPVDY